MASASSSSASASSDASYLLSAEFVPFPEAPVSCVAFSCAGLLTITGSVVGPTTHLTMNRWLGNCWAAGPVRMRARQGHSGHGRR
jgi:hypothetical protein